MEHHTISLHRLTLHCTLRCLLGCNVGEVTGMIIGSLLGFDIALTITIAIILAFATGYTFTMIPLLKRMSLRKAFKVAISGDTASIASMEFAENSIAFLISGFMVMSLFDPMYWVGLAIMIPFGFMASYPVMYWVMKRDTKSCCNI